MTIYETIGYAWVIFTVVLSTVALSYFAWKGVSSAWRQRERGETEETLDIRRACEDRYLIERAGRTAAR